MAAFDIKLFAILRDRFGAETVSVDVPAGTTATQLLESLRTRFPDHATHLASCRVALNRRFASGPETLSPGDEIALIPPVSGG